MKFSLFSRSMNWQKSPAHLLLLSKFMKPAEASWFIKDNWKTALEESPSKVIDRFISDGVIKLADVAQKLDAKYKVTELKEMLRTRNLVVSGNKPVLIERLLENDPMAMKQLTNNLKIYSCTSEGYSIAENYLKLVHQQRTQAEKSVLDALQNRKWEQASRIVANFESNQVFSRGLGINWKKYNSERDVTMLKIIFQNKPKILNNVPNDKLNQLRNAAGMMYLWGTNEASKWLNDDFSTGLVMENDAAARMFMFHAYHINNLVQYKSAGIKRVKILGANDGRTCKACKALANKVYAIDKVPELPNQDCTCIDGCRCTTVAEI